MRDMLVELLDARKHKIYKENEFEALLRISKNLTQATPLIGTAVPEKNGLSLIMKVFQ